MAQVINTNIMSLNAQRNLNQTNSAMQQSVERLSSGLRINSAADDAAGLAISERFTSQIKGQDQAIRNSNDGLSFAQTAEGALDEVGNMSQRIRELAVQSANDTNSDSDREAINNEVKQLVEEVDRIANSTEFNGQKILDGSEGELSFQVGANQGQSIEVEGTDSRASSLGAKTRESQGLDSGGAIFENDGGSTGMQLNGNVGNGTSGSASSGDVVEISGQEYTFATSGDADPDKGTFNSVEDLVSAINKNTGSTGVEAQQNESLEVNLGEVDFDDTAGSGMDLTIEGQDFAVGGTTGSNSVEALAQEINDSSLQTSGITAKVEDNELKLESSNGGSIEIEADNTGDSSFEGLAEENFTSSNDGPLNFEAGLSLNSKVSDSIDFSYDGDGQLKENLNLSDTESRTLANSSVGTREDAAETITTMDYVISQVSEQRSQLGAAQNRMESAISNLEVGSENLNAARSRIQDTDFAKESSELTRNQVLQQAGTSMLGQANQVPQNALSLLQ